MPRPVAPDDIVSAASTIGLILAVMLFETMPAVTVA